jgi:uncharacterized iron-regulated membrane protein
MSYNRSLAALTILGVLVLGVVGLYCLATAVPSALAAPAHAVHPEGTGGYGYGYGSKTPTPSRSRSYSPTPSASVSHTPLPSSPGELPETGRSAGPVAMIGLLSLVTGIGLVAGTWIWQARERGRAASLSRGRNLDRRSGQRHQ